MIFIYRLFGFILFYLKEVLLANVRVAAEILRRSYTMEPGVVAIPLDVKSDWELLLFANVITMTPGTLSLDISADRSTLYVHAMFVGDPDELVKTLKQRIEKKVIELFRK
jgi:multicomponent Na+:H+ antiporter subunit E